MRNMKTFPLFIDVAGRRPLVVGGGCLAAAKVRTILQTAPHVDVAALDVVDELEATEFRGVVRWLRRSVHAEDIRNRPFVVAASENEDEDLRVSDLAMDLGVPVNVPDRPELSTFAFGALVTRGDVTVAIGTNGTAPVLAARLRAWLEAELSPWLGRLAEVAASYRESVARVIAPGPARRRLWEAIFDGAAAQAVLAGDEAQGRQHIEALIDGRPGRVAEGRIALVGAGPGDPEFMTMAAVRALKAADVVLHDRLVGRDVLDLARREAELVEVGKRSGEASVRQTDINNLMIRHARAGKYIVRLKGGDGLVFGRAAEELGAVQRAGIAVDVVPGITAAQAAAAQLRLPLTTRRDIQQFSLVTASGADGDTRLDWVGLAEPGHAFAVYMGLRRAGGLARRLIGAGADAAARVVIVENAARSDTRAVATDLRSLGAAALAAQMTGPALLLVGLDWQRAGLAAPDWVENFVRPERRSAAADASRPDAPKPASPAVAEAAV